GRGGIGRLDAIGSDKRHVSAGGLNRAYMQLAAAADVRDTGYVNSAARRDVEQGSRPAFDHQRDVAIRHYGRIIEYRRGRVAEDRPARGSQRGHATFRHGDIALHQQVAAAGNVDERGSRATDEIDVNRIVGLQRMDVVVLYAELDGDVGVIALLLQPAA